MPKFDALKYSYPSHRNVVYAKKGMAASTSPIASQVGIDVMKNGGNAMDAAIAMATTLPLVEPDGDDTPGAEVFHIQILFREHYTWQGRMIWENENQETVFHSAVELLQMLDEILAE